MFIMSHSLEFASMTHCSDTAKVDHVYRLGLAQPGDVPRFQQWTREILNLNLPEDYLQRGKILVLRDQRDQICGGCLVVLQPEFRSLQSIPSTQRKSFPYDSERLAEVNAVWLSPGIKSPILPLTFWRQLALFLLSTHREQFLFTYDHGNRQMRKFASWLCHQVIYSGQTKQLEGMPGPALETIALVSRDSLLYLHHKLHPQAVGSAVPRYANLEHAPSAVTGADPQPAEASKPERFNLGG